MSHGDLAAVSQYSKFVGLRGDKDPHEAVEERFDDVFDSSGITAIFLSLGTTRKSENCLWCQWTNRDPMWLLA